MSLSLDSIQKKKKTIRNNLVYIEKLVMRTSNKWLDAQSEHRTTLRALPSCLSLCDLKNDNYYKLITAEIPTDIENGKSRLKVYKGTTLVNDQGLPDVPSAVESFYIDEYEPKVPIVAVSIGPSVLFYRNMKPYYKYTLSSMPIIEPLEIEIWKKLVYQKFEEIPALIEKLKTIEKTLLSNKSQQLLSLPEDKIFEFIKNEADVELVRLSTITAMATLKKSSSDENAISCLILATESGDIIFLDSQAFTVLHQARVCSFKTTPTMISATGQFDVDYRMVIASREGPLCILRKSWLEGRQIVKLDHPTIGLALLPIDQTIIVVCMNKSLECYSKKGKRLWAVELIESALCMVPIHLAQIGMTLVCVALRGGLVQLYLQKNLVDQFSVPDPVSAMTFGKLGQEDHVLVLITTAGSLIVKILKRTAEFKVKDDVNSYDTIMPAVGNLLIPKKKKVFVEQTLRERENASTIYHNFQMDLWRFRLTAARATVDTINSAESTLSSDNGLAPIKMAAEVRGLGPVFRLFIIIENMSARKQATNVTVVLHADNRHYTLENPYVSLPPLVPGVPIKIDFKVTAIVDPNDGLPPSDLTPENSVIRVMIIKSGQAKPLIAATVSMPTPEPLENDIY